MTKDDETPQPPTRPALWERTTRMLTVVELEELRADARAASEYARKVFAKYRKGE